MSQMPTNDQIQAFNEAEKAQANGESRLYIGTAKSFVSVDPARAMTMIARQKNLLHYRLKNGDLLDLLEEYAERYNLWSHYIDLCLERNESDFLTAAVNRLLLDSDMPRDDETEKIAQRQKLSLIDALANQRKDKSITRHSLGLLKSLSMVRGFANNETTERVLTVLANNASAPSCIAINDILTGAHRIGVVGPQYESKPEKSEFTARALMVANKNPSYSYPVLRHIANRVGGELLKEVAQFLEAQDSLRANKELAQLMGDEIKHLTKLFNTNAIGAMNALVDMRVESVREQLNNVIDLDQAIVQCVKKLTDQKSEKLVSLIISGQAEELKVLFDRLAETGIADLRQKFEKAVKVADVKQLLSAAENELDQVMVDLPKIDND